MSRVAVTGGRHTGDMVVLVALSPVLALLALLAVACDRWGPEDPPYPTALGPEPAWARAPRPAAGRAGGRAMGAGP